MAWISLKKAEELTGINSFNLRRYAKEKRLITFRQFLPGGVIQLDEGSLLNFMNNGIQEVDLDFEVKDEIKNIDK